MQENRITKEGKKKLEERLDYLKVDGRKEVADRIAAARDFGDLSENAEYDIAREDQARVEAEIKELEYQLSNVVIIDEKNKSGCVDFGSKITIKNLRNGQTYEYTLVGTIEADPVNGKISNESALGSAVLGAKVGDRVVVSAPVGKDEYDIIKVK